MTELVQTIDRGLPTPLCDDVSGVYGPALSTAHVGSDVLNHLQRDNVLVRDAPSTGLPAPRCEDVAGVYPQASHHDLNMHKGAGASDSTTGLPSPRCADVQAVYPAGSAVDPSDVLHSLFPPAPMPQNAATGLPTPNCDDVGAIYPAGPAQDASERLHMRRDSSMPTFLPTPRCDDVSTVYGDAIVAAGGIDPNETLHALSRADDAPTGLPAPKCDDSKRVYAVNTETGTAISDANEMLNSLH